MAERRRIAKQWLETDAAFGVSEAPLRPARTPQTPCAAPSPGKPARTAAAAPPPPGAINAAVAAMRSPPSPPLPATRPLPPAQRRDAASPPSPPPSPRRAAPSLIPGIAPRPAAASARGKVPLPPPPAGDVAALPPLTKRQKIDLLEHLRQEVDQSCAAHLNDIATRIVFGEGNPDAELMFVGEGPGTEEDRTGRPFVGRSGQLLDKMIGAIGFKREDVYIANVVKLRCADWDDMRTRLTDRPPTPEEVARGLPILHRQIEIIRPKVIVTLGAPAVKYLTGTTEGVMKIRGTWLSYRGIPVMPTYHPSFVLRAYTPENRGKVWSDLKLAVAKIKES